MNESTKVIQERLVVLDKINNQRRLWLYLSSTVVMYAIIIITGIDYIFDDKHKKIGWAIMCASLILSINWWYWTMSIIRTLINDLYLEYSLLSEIIDEVSEIVKEHKNIDL